MSVKISAPKGMEDILPGQSGRWRNIEKQLRDAARRFGFEEIRFPTFEHTELFLRGMGDTTDVVQKEMFTFRDRGDRSVTLRPEGTASVVRAFIEHGMQVEVMPRKFYYIAPNFRAEKPQKGRLREHHQFGAECLGSAHPAADAEVISLAWAVLDELKLLEIPHGANVAPVRLMINSMGCPVCRPDYQKALRDFLTPKRDGLCDTCRERLDRNPSRVLDCKSEECKALAAGAPRFLDFLCKDCERHFNGVEAYLKALNIVYEIDPGIVRGFDYYNRTVFEFVTSLIGAQATVCGGGRYDGLVETLGGQSTPALGFGMGIERLILTLDAAGKRRTVPPKCDIYIAPIGDAADALSLVLCDGLRRMGLRAERDICGRGLKAQMKYADKIGAQWVLVIGEDEVTAGAGVLRNMREKIEKTCELDAETISSIVTAYANSYDSEAII